MERKNRKTSSGAALYAAVAVCLLAAGVGGYRMLHRNANAEKRTAIVSGPARLPDTPAKTPLPETPVTPYGEDEPSVSASGGAEIPAETDYAGETIETESTDMTEISETSGTTETPDLPAASETQTSDSDTQAGNTDIRPVETALRPAAKPSAAPSAKPSAAETSPSPTPTVSTPAVSTDTASAPSTSADANPAVMPLEGDTVTAFSMDELLYNETLRDWRTHDGIDIAADEGAQVLAAFSGTVTAVEDDPLLGTTVTIRHEGALETVYACLAPEIETEAGEEVSAGQVIGFVGGSGPAEAALEPHLHFSVREDGNAVNPSDYLPLS